jgi:hypothetical protein
MTKDEAIRLALTALENAPIEYDFHGNPMDAEFGKQLDVAITALRQALEQAENNQFKPDWDAMTVMVEEQQRMASQIATNTHVLKTVNSAAMKLTSDLCRMEVDDDDRVSRDRVMERIVQWRNEWDKAMSNNTSTPLYTAPPKREWVGLTDEDRYLNEARSEEEIEYARAIEAKLKEKNGG